MITELLYLILFTSIIVLALKIATSEAMIFEELGRFGEKKVDEGRSIFKALINCVYCMPSVYTGVAMVLAMLLGVWMPETIMQGAIMYLLTVGGSSVVAGVIFSLIGLINSAIEYLDASKKYYENASQNEYYNLRDRKREYKRNAERISNNRQKVHY